MLTTKELEIYIRKELNTSIYKDELIKDLNHFYVFSEDIVLNKFGPFSFVYADSKGYRKIGVGDRGDYHKDNNIIYNLYDICFEIFWDISFRLSTPPYYIVNDFVGDWRRWSFKKRLEILSSIDKKYEESGRQIINVILHENPYTD
ncbi:hypothetical protein [Anaerorhabdus sp.]|uniref:hypothetical protein n=1 Tax=Anaerorhabdus sp. TaxID=1872524 RepID=UPI002FC933CC